MPKNPDHSKYTFRIYGVTGSDIHRWIDEPSRKYGPSHRKFRHHSDDELPQWIVDNYKPGLARKIQLLHYELDDLIDKHRIRTKTVEYVEVIKEVEVPRKIPRKKTPIPDSFYDEVRSILREVNESWGGQ